MTPQITERVVEVLEVTASNLRSIGPAGALDPYVTYRPWLEHVEQVLNDLKREQK
jgi:hypothetical protein